MNKGIDESAGYTEPDTVAADAGLSIQRERTFERSIVRSPVSQKRIAENIANDAYRLNVLGVLLLTLISKNVIFSFSLPHLGRRPVLQEGHHMNTTRAIT